MFLSTLLQIMTQIKQNFRCLQRDWFRSYRLLSLMLYLYLPISYLRICVCRLKIIFTEECAGTFNEIFSSAFCTKISLKNLFQSVGVSLYHWSLQVILFVYVTNSGNRKLLSNSDWRFTNYKFVFQAIDVRNSKWNYKAINVPLNIDRLNLKLKIYPKESVGDKTG